MRDRQINSMRGIDIQIDAQREENREKERE